MTLPEIIMLVAQTVAISALVFSIYKLREAARLQSEALKLQRQALQLLDTIKILQQ